MKSIQQIQRHNSSEWLKIQQSYADLFDHPDAISFTILVEPPKHARYGERPLYKIPYEFSKRLFKAVDVAAFGEKFFKRPLSDRTLGCLVPESLGTYPHYHGILVPPTRDATQPDKIMNVIDEAAKRLCYPTTTTWANSLTTPRGMFLYMMKENDIHDLGGHFSFEF
jgi:hypothetical protein